LFWRMRRPNSDLGLRLEQNLVYLFIFIFYFWSALLSKVHLKICLTQSIFIFYFLFYFIVSQRFWATWCCQFTELNLFIFFIFIFLFFVGQGSKQLGAANLFDLIYF
jgi:hypothetical protein